MARLRTLFIAPLVAACLAGASAEISWKAYDSPPGRFTIQVPGLKPEEATEHNQSPLGQVDEHTLRWRSGELEWVVEYTDVPDAATSFHGSILFVEVRRGFQKTTGQPTQNEQNFKLGEYPGRTFEYSFAAKGMEIARAGVARVFLVEQRLYVLTVTWDKPALPADRGAATHFFDSFKLADLK